MAEDGKLGGTVGFLTVVAPESVRVTVAAVDADGEAIAGELIVTEVAPSTAGTSASCNRR